tara:strand:- start:3553 stop:4269 length:717 start_codon:yes stop_codon:yes gene_type:complete
MFFINLVRNLVNIFDFFQQKKIIKFFKKNLNKEIVLFDVGGHFGETIKLFYKNFKIKKIHSFEASPDNFKILLKNLKNLNLESICVPNNIGLGEKRTSTFLNYTKESSSSTINEFNRNSKYLKKKLKILNINKNNYYKKIPIQIISLDDYIENKKIENIDILKIDTEGFEMNVLKGLSINYKIVTFIYFEHHYDDMIIKNYTFGDINEILLRYGFKKIYKSKMFFRKSFEYIYQNTIN